MKKRIKDKNSKYAGFVLISEVSNTITKLS